MAAGGAFAGAVVIGLRALAAGLLVAAAMVVRADEILPVRTADGAACAVIEGSLAASTPPALHLAESPLTLPAACQLLRHRRDCPLYLQPTVDRCLLAHVPLPPRWLANNPPAPSSPCRAKRRN